MSDDNTSVFQACSDPPQNSSGVSLSYHKHCPFPLTSSFSPSHPIPIFILLMVSVTQSLTLQQMHLLFTTMHRHLLVACETVLLIVELHSPELLKYKTGNNANKSVVLSIL